MTTFFLELVVGIEPTTFSLRVRCSAIEPHQQGPGNIISGNSRSVKPEFRFRRRFPPSDVFHSGLLGRIIYKFRYTQQILNGKILVERCSFTDISAQITEETEELPMVISSFEALKKQLRDLPPVPAVIAAAHDSHTLEAVFAAQEDGLIEPLLVGHGEEIRSLARQLGREVPLRQIIEAGDEADCARQAVALIRAGRGSLLIKGMMQTGTLLSAAVDRTSGIRRAEVMSHVAILDVPAYHKLLYITDGGMVIAPDLEQKRHILRNALEFCRFLGYEQPKAAALCAVEVVNPHMVETQDGAALKEEALRGDFGPCLVEGPISLDLATDPKAVAVKHYESPVAGDADILLAPSIAAGNLLGKSLYGMAGGMMAGVVLGAAVPIVINSRGAEPEEKYDSILICTAMAAGSPL